MNLTGGIILCAAAVAMLFFGRAREEGEPLRIFRVYIVGQLYVMTAMSLGVFGVAVVIINWPF